MEFIGGTHFDAMGGYEGCEAEHEFHVVSGHLILNDVNFFPDHLFAAKEEVFHGDVLFDAIALAVDSAKPKS